MRLGYASSSDDDTIYFDDGTKYIRWIDSAGEFRLNDDLYVTNNFRFDGEITPGASTCSDNQILKRVSGVWTCAVDSGLGTCSDCNADFVNEGQSSSITSAMITDGTIANADISNTAGIAWSKISCSDCINAGNIGSSAVGTSEIISTQVQRRVSGTCAAGSSISVVNEDGTVSCETDDDTNANTLCSGTSTYLDGEGNCDTLTSYPGNCGADQVRVAGTCRTIPDCDAETQTLNYDQTTDTWSCLTDDSGGTDTNAGTICSGTTTYLDGEGNCDNIDNVYVNQNGDTMTGTLQFGSGTPNGKIYWDSVNNRLVIEVS